MAQVREEAEDFLCGRTRPRILYCARPLLASAHLEEAVIHRGRPSRLVSEHSYPARSIIAEYSRALAAIQQISDGFSAPDIHRRTNTRPGCDRFIEPFLYIQGLPRHPDASTRALGSGGGKRPILRLI